MITHSLLERRNLLRRSLAGGLVVGMAAAVFLGLLDGLLAVFRGDFDGWMEALQFVGCDLALAAMVGALAGLLLGALQVGADRLVASARRVRQPIWRARLATALAIPAVAIVVEQLFSGRRAQLLPGHDALVVFVGLILLAVIYSVMRFGQLLAAQLGNGLGRVRTCLLMGSLAAVTVLLLLVDARVLPRLYPAFHAALEVLQFASAWAFAGGLYLLAQRQRPSWVKRVAEPWTALGVWLVAVAIGALGLRAFAMHEPLRATAYRQACIAPRLLDLSHGAGLCRTRDLPLPSPPPVSPAALLPPGPLVPDADVVLITVDAMRADRLNQRTTPHLAALAEHGVVFDRAYAQVPHTSFSLTTLLTGKYVYSLASMGAVSARHETLAEVFQRDRYKTAAFFPPSVFFIDHDHFMEVEEARYRFEYVKYEHLGARGRTDQVIAFLEGERPQRAFVWVHYFEPHEPYESHEGGVPPSASDNERYDGEISFVDGEVARLVEYLRTHRPRAIIAFAADHGEEFGEHGGRYHGTTLYEEQIRVPLFVVALERSGILPAGRHIRGPVGLVDLAPTLLTLVGITPSAKMRGQDLGPWLSRGGADETKLRPVFSEIGAHKLLGLANERLICDLARDLCELYDLASDPAEQHNLAGRAPHEERARHLQAQLRAWLADQAAFERAPTGAEPSELAAQRALERARQGDRSAVRELGPLLAVAPPPRRIEAAQALLALPADPALHDAIARARAQDSDDPWLRTLALRLGETELAEGLATYAERATIDPFLRGEIALALAALHHRQATPLLAAALEKTHREDQALRLIEALGQSHDRRAERPLVAHLSDVRTRLAVVHALGVLPAREIAPKLAELISDEPYVPVRTEMASVLGKLGDRRTLASLRRLRTKEKEPQVRRALDEALATLRGR